MGHTLSVITRNIFHEFGVFHGAYSEENANLLRDASKSASRRYLQQMDVIEAYLAKNGINVCDHDLCEERKAILQIVKPAVNSEEVQLKAANILDNFVPRFVTSRLQRLHNLVDKLRIDKIPDVLQKSDRLCLIKTLCTIYFFHFILIGPSRLQMALILLITR